MPEILNPEEKIVPLTALERGTVAEVLRFDMTDRNTLRKLLSLGIVPGTLVKMIHTFPSYVIQVESSQLVFDKQIASAIRVKLLEENSSM